MKAEDARKARGFDARSHSSANVRTMRVPGASGGSGDGSDGGAAGGRGGRKGGGGRVGGCGGGTIGGGSGGGGKSMPQVLHATRHAVMNASVPQSVARNTRPSAVAHPKSSDDPSKGFGRRAHLSVSDMPLGTAEKRREHSTSG